MSDHYKHGGDSGQRGEATRRGGMRPGPSTEPLLPRPEGGPLPDVPGYRILRRIGEGGMGWVFEAEQGTPHRHVALKVIRSVGFVTEEQVRLFRREIESLGRLNHPGIAAIHDAGRTPFGQHYFAMELVEGLTLDDWVRRGRRAGTPGKAVVRERLELFLKVCDAIGYAHQRGVIHRDLKPSNIIVVDRSSSSSDVAPVPGVKVLDFGLARITDSDVSLTTMETETGKIRGTLAYMSPEQARGNPDDIDMRTDVYSLGVILYELLTGERPYDVRKTLIPEAVRVICEEEPRPPSAIDRTFRGDVETIALRALEKDPDRRYPTVAALSEDVRRYVSDEPILARPPSTVYQLRKLIARHPGAFAFAATVFVLLLASTITMSFLYEGQRRERQRAETETAKAERTSAFLQDMLASIDPSKAHGREISVREVLDEAARRTEKELSDQPDVQAAIQRTIAKTYASLLHPAQAGPQFEAAYRTLAERYGEEHPDVLRAKLDLAVWRDNDEEMLREVIETVRRALGPDHPLMADALLRLGARRGGLGHDAEAESLITEAIRIRENIYGRDADLVVQVLQDLAKYQKQRGDMEAARATYRRALDSYRRTHADDEDLWVATYVLRLAQSYPEDPVKADSLWWESLRLAREGAGGDHPVLATWIKDGGVRRFEEGNYAEAESLFRESMEMRLRLFGDENRQPGTSTTNLAELLHIQGRLDEAEHYYEEALRLFGRGDISDRQDISAPDPRLLVWPLRGYAELLLVKGDPEAAESLFREYLDLVTGWKGEDAWQAADGRLRLGSCLVELGRFAEAESLMVPALPLVQASAGWLQPGSDAWDEESSPLWFKRTALEKMIRLYEREGRPGEADSLRARLGDIGET